MFVQVVQGRVKDAEAVRRQIDRWKEELQPGATGWIGATAGVSADNEYIAVVRFESEEAARANSERPEQGAWAEEMAKLSEGDVTFHDCREVDLMLGGGSDDAGFVQVIQGRTSDQERLRALGQELEDSLRQARPDVLGGLIAWHGDGGFTQVVYFSSEAEARKGESQEPSGDDAARMEELMGLMSDLRYVDLTDPWLESA